MMNKRDKKQTTNDTPTLRWLKPFVLAGLSTNRTAVGALASLLLVGQASAGSFSFSTGNPDGKIATVSRPPSAGGIQTETADDFRTTNSIVINQATFTGLIPAGADLSSIRQVEIEIYHVFPGDSDTNRTLNVQTRANSPGDTEI